jgi:hypothetical protein
MNDHFRKGEAKDLNNTLSGAGSDRRKEIHERICIETLQIPAQPYRACMHSISEKNGTKR